MEACIKEIIIRESIKNGVDQNFLYSLVMVESSGNPWASRVEFHYPYLVDPELYARKLGITKSTEVINQRTSYGLVQIMGGVCRELGFKSHLPKVFAPALNLTLGLTLIKKLTKKYDGDMHKVASAYNYGHAKINKETGKFVNQKYVDKIFRIFSKEEL